MGIELDPAELNQGLVRAYLALPVRQPNPEYDDGDVVTPPKFLYEFRRRDRSPYGQRVLAIVDQALEKATITDPFKRLLKGIFEHLATSGRNFVEGHDQSETTSDYMDYEDKQLREIIGFGRGRFTGIFRKDTALAIEAWIYRDAFDVFDHQMRFDNEPPPPEFMGHAEWVEIEEDCVLLDYFFTLGMDRSDEIRTFLNEWRQKIFNFYEVYPEDTLHA